MKRRNVMNMALVMTVLFAAISFQMAQAGTHQVAHNYFPLHDGDRWVYVQRVDGIDRPDRSPYPLQVVRVMGSERSESGDDAFTLGNYTFRLGEGSIRFTSDLNGRVIEIHGREMGGWYDFRPGRPVSLPMFANDCIHGSKGVVLAPRELGVPAGDFKDCLEIRYETVPCAEAGLVSEIFAPGIGLIQRRVQIMGGGIEIWSLKYAKVNGFVFTGPVGHGSAPDDRELSTSPTLPEASSWGNIKAVFGN